MRTDDLHIEYHAGKYQVVRTSNGIDDRINVGPRWLLPRTPSPTSSRSALGLPMSRWNHPAGT